MRLILLLFIAVFVFSKNILILNSYSVQFPWTKGEVEGILKNLKNTNNKIYIEFMDTKLFTPTDKYLNNFYHYIKLKYENIPFNIVITTDDNALNFVLNHKGLFKNSKIFFAGVNNLSIANKIDRNVCTGVFEKKEPLANLRFLQKVIPNLKKVYVVGDNSNSAKAVMREYKDAFKNIRDIRFVYINDSDLIKVISKIKNYKNSGMLLLTPFSFHLNSKHINYKKAIALLSKYYKSPMVIHTDILAPLPNSNIIGGKVTDAISQGESVSKKVLAYLNGTEIKDIPLTYEKANKMYLNVKNLKKFNINPYSLNYKNAIYVNSSNSYKKYKKYLKLIVIIVVFLILLIIILLFKNYKLTQYSKKVEALNKTFEDEFKNKYKEFSIKYSKFLETQIEAVNSVIKLLVNNINRLLYKMENNEDVKDDIKKLKEIILLYGSDSKNLHIKQVLEDINELLNYNISIKGEDFEINLDKILFTKMMIDLLENESEVILENKKITIQYKNRLNKEEIKNKIEKYFKEIKDLKINSNKIIIKLR